MPIRKPKTVSLKVGIACANIKPPRLPNSCATPRGVGRRYFGIPRSGTTICQRMIRPRKKSTDHVAFPWFKLEGVSLLICRLSQEYPLANRYGPSLSSRNDSSILPVLLIVILPKRVLREVQALRVEGNG